MARVTIDDCTDKIENRFDLVLFASYRARQSLEGVTLQLEDTLAQKFEKTTVQALREIAEGDITPESLEEGFIVKMQNERNIQKTTEEPTVEPAVAEEDIHADTPQLETEKTAATATDFYTPPSAPSSPMAQATVAFDDDVPDEDT